MGNRITESFTNKHLHDPQTPDDTRNSERRRPRFRFIVCNDAGGGRKRRTSSSRPGGEEDEKQNKWGHDIIRAMRGHRRCRHQDNRRALILSSEDTSCSDTTTCWRALSLSVILQFHESSLLSCRLVSLSLLLHNTHAAFKCRQTKRSCKLKLSWQETIPFIYTILYSKHTFYSFQRVSDLKVKRSDKKFSWQTFVDIMMLRINSLNDLWRKLTDAFICPPSDAWLTVLERKLSSHEFERARSAAGRLVRRRRSEVRSAPCSLGHESSLCLFDFTL